MNRIFLLFSVSMAAVLVANCNLPRIDLAPATATSTFLPIDLIPTATQALPSVMPLATTAELGMAENPLILALPPSAGSQAQVDAAKTIASQFTQRTGYTVVTIIPEDYTALVDALANGNAHIVLLDPYAYELAYQRDLVRAAYAVLKEEEGTYGAQFLASRREGFTSYFDEGLQENTTEDPLVALAQFAGKKPCWSDERSPSGYVVPLGYLRANQILTKPPAFVEGHPTVVRSIYASGICDFGATYVDARKFPSLEDQFPDLIEQVMVVWRIPPIIPYEVLAFSTQMPVGMRELFAAQVPAILQTEEGKAAFQTAYGAEMLEPVNDAYYDEFRKYVNASGVDLGTLITIK